MNKELIVNGKHYPLWSQFVERKKEWIGGILEDFGDDMDVMLGCKPIKTEIIDIALTPNGETSAFFGVGGKDFTCGFDVRVGGIVAGEDDWLTFSGYGNHKWRIKKNET